MYTTPIKGVLRDPKRICDNLSVENDSESGESSRFALTPKSKKELCEEAKVVEPAKADISGKNS